MQLLKNDLFANKMATIDKRIFRIPSHIARMSGNILVVVLMMSVRSRLPSRERLP